MINAEVLSEKKKENIILNSINLLVCIKSENGNGECVKETTNDQRTENSQRQPIGLKHSKKTLYLELCFNWLINKFCTM